MEDDDYEFTCDDLPDFSDDEEEEDAEEEPADGGSSGRTEPAPAQHTLRDGRRFAAIFCSPAAAPLNGYLLEAAQMLEAGVLSPSADLSQGATLSTFRTMLETFDPHVVWFVGHGDATLSGNPTLVWTTSDGRIQLMDAQTCADALIRATPRHGGSLECVVLNACCTMAADSTVGWRLRQGGVPFVAGWRSKLHDEAGPWFAKGFLAGLQHGADYNDAFEAGCAEVRRQLEPPSPALRTVSNPHHGGAVTAAGGVERFALVDPDDAALVVQPAIGDGPAQRAWHRRVRRGCDGEGRVAAGVPVCSEMELPELSGVPLLPTHTILRPDWVQHVASSLLVRDSPALATRGVLIAASLHGIHGAGGLGKTVLAQMVCGSRRVRYAFPDGIFWLTVGEEPNIVELQASLLRALARRLRNGQATRQLQSSREGREELAVLLRGRSCLIVLDDVWRGEHLRQLLQDCVSATSMLLVTTRNADQFNFAAEPVQLGALTHDQARELLLRSARLRPEQVAEQELAGAVQALVERSHGIPLAVCIAGSLVDGEVAAVERVVRAWDVTLETPGASDSAPGYTHRSLVACFEVSLQALPPLERERLLDLAVYPEDARVPLLALAA